MTVKKPTIACPTCNKPGTWSPDNKFRPFCCERCKLIDLGAWAGEQHRIAGEPVDPHSTSSSEDKAEES